MAVYLLHSTIPIVSSQGVAVRHYLGCCQEGRIHERLAEHRRGHSTARVVKAFLEAGGELQVGNYWPLYDYDDERRLKKNGHLGEHCLRCKVDKIISILQELPF